MSTATKRAKLTWLSWHRQAGTPTDEPKDLSGWKARVWLTAVDRRDICPPEIRLPDLHAAAAATATYR